MWPRRAINWNVPGLAFMELTLNQSDTFLRLYLRSENTCSRSLLQLYNVLPSAILYKYHFAKEKKSFMKILKIRRPSIGSCSC